MWAMYFFPDKDMVSVTLPFLPLALDVDTMPGAEAAML